MLGLDEGGAEAALVAEGYHDVVIGAGLVEGLGIAPGGGHGLFAVDGLDAASGGVLDHGAVLAGPGADADQIEVFAVEHGAIVVVDIGDGEVLGEGLSGRLNGVGAGGDSDIVGGLVALGVGAAATAAADKAGFVGSHIFALLISLRKIRKPTLKHQMRISL